MTGSQSLYIVVLCSIDEANDKQHSCIVFVRWLLSPVLYRGKYFVLQEQSYLSSSGVYIQTAAAVDL